MLFPGPFLCGNLKNGSIGSAGVINFSLVELTGYRYGGNYSLPLSSEGMEDGIIRPIRRDSDRILYFCARLTRAIL